MAFKWLKKKKEKTDPPEKIEEEALDTPSADETIENKAAGKEPSSGDFSAEADESDAEAQDTPDIEPEKDDGPAVKKSSGLFARLKSGLSKTRKILTTDIDELFLGKKIVDDEMIEDLEELLITSDIGVRTATDLIDRISRQSRKISGPDQLREALKKEILELVAESRPARNSSRRRGPMW